MFYCNIEIMQSQHTTRGVANVGWHWSFGAVSPARAFSSGDENVTRSPTLATPPAVVPNGWKSELKRLSHWLTVMENFSKIANLLIDNLFHDWGFALVWLSSADLKYFFRLDSQRLNGKRAEFKLHWKLKFSKAGLNKRVELKSCIQWMFSIFWSVERRGKCLD